MDENNPQRPQNPQQLPGQQVQPVQQYQPQQQVPQNPQTLPPPQMMPAAQKSSKIGLIIITALVSFGLGIGGGIVIQQRFLQKPSKIDQIIDSQFKAIYGDNYEEELEKSLQEIQDSSQNFELRIYDTERKTDINAMHTHLEVYYNDYGFYPEADIFNSKDTANRAMPGLDSEAIVDPGGTLVNGGGDYSYSPLECKSGECQDYSITTSLEEDDSPYTKNALN